MIVPLRLANTRSLILLLLILTLTYILLFRVLPAFHHHVISPLQYHTTQVIDRPYAFASSNLTVNLVVASQKSDDISWTSHLPIPNLQVIRYVSDDPNAQYRPPILNKGREALMYHTYLAEFYDSLPDISIFTHSEELPWHMDGSVQQSMTFALSHLNLSAVAERGYFNLRTSWRNACPNWINTTKTVDDWDKREEPFISWAWRENFRDDPPPPEILAGTCCSQFVVSKEAVRSREKSQYEWNREWLRVTDWSDYISGRVWEHMWPWLFIREPVDCIPEWENLCKHYGICFETAHKLQAWEDAWEQRKNWTQEVNFWNEIWDRGWARDKRLGVLEIDQELSIGLEEALERGADVKERERILRQAAATKEQGRLAVRYSVAEDTNG